MGINLVDNGVPLLQYTCVPSLKWIPLKVTENFDNFAHNKTGTFALTCPWGGQSPKRGINLYKLHDPEVHSCLDGYSSSPVKVYKQYNDS